MKKLIFSNVMGNKRLLNYTREDINKYHNKKKYSFLFLAIVKIRTLLSLCVEVNNQIYQKYLSLLHYDDLYPPTFFSR